MTVTGEIPTTETGSRISITIAQATEEETNTEG